MFLVKLNIYLSCGPIRHLSLKTYIHICLKDLFIIVSFIITKACMSTKESMGKPIVLYKRVVLYNTNYSERKKKKI